jgi:hypothetical protein
MSIKGPSKLQMGVGMAGHSECHRGIGSSYEQIEQSFAAQASLVGTSISFLKAKFELLLKDPGNVNVENLLNNAIQDIEDIEKELNKLLERIGIKTDVKS